LTAVRKAFDEAESHSKLLQLDLIGTKAALQQRQKESESIAHERDQHLAAARSLSTEKKKLQDLVRH
jgi:hypothetical protein